MRQECIPVWSFLGVSIFNTVCWTSVWLPDFWGLLYSPSLSFFTSVFSLSSTPSLPSTYLPLDTYLEPSSPGPLCLHPLPFLPQGSCRAWQGAEGDGLRPVEGPRSCYYCCGLLLSRECSHMSCIRRGCLHFLLPDPNKKHIQLCRAPCVQAAAVGSQKLS